MLAAMLLTCCQSTKTYIDRPVVPELVFPVFPELSGAVRNADGTVTVGADWIVRLAEFRIRLDETEKNYNELKALYAGKEKKDGEENF